MVSPARPETRTLRLWPLGGLLELMSDTSSAPFPAVPEFPETPFAADGSFQWLAETGVHQEWAMNFDTSCIENLKRGANDAGITLPGGLANFFQDPSLGFSPAVGTR